MAEKQQSKRLNKQQDKQVDEKKTKSKQVKKVDNQDKKGGAFVNDVKNLAVPFAILLAKEGLTKYFKDDKSADKKTSSTSKKSESAKSSKSSTSSLSRRRTMAGGSCNLGCGALTGGAAAKQLVALQEQIDNFLEKY